MRRNLFILVCLSLATLSSVSVVVVCEKNLPVKITDLDGYVDLPSISDDGSKVAFIATTNEYVDLFVVNSDGSGFKH